MHIGLIGGIGPAATEFYYRGLIDRHAASGTALDCTIVHADVRDLSRNLANGDAQQQADVFAPLVRRLAAAGAAAAAVTSMGGHFCIRELEALSPLPLLNALPAVDAAIKERGLKTVGIIGTRMVMETRLYGAITSAAVMVPEGGEFNDVQANYGAMATVRLPEQRRRVRHCLARAVGAAVRRIQAWLRRLTRRVRLRRQLPGRPVPRLHRIARSGDAHPEGTPPRRRTAAGVERRRRRQAPMRPD